MKVVSRARAGFAAALAIVAVVSVGVFAASATPCNASAVTNAALGALSHQNDAVTAGAQTRRRARCTRASSSTRM